MHEALFGLSIVSAAAPPDFTMTLVLCSLRIRRIKIEEVGTYTTVLRLTQILSESASGFRRRPFVYWKVHLALLNAHTGVSLARMMNIGSSPRSSLRKRNLAYSRSAFSIHGMIPLSIFSSTAENVIWIDSFHWFVKLIKSHTACNFREATTQVG